MSASTSASTPQTTLNAPSAMPDSAQPTNQKPVLLQIRHLSKSYGDTQILQNINLDIYDGEFLTLLGPSGCGKTTLLRLIGGFELPNAGSLHLEGVDIAGLPAEKRPINTVFQQYALFPHMNVYDNIAYGLKLKGVPKTEIDQRVREALAMVQLDHTINRRPQDLSGVSSSVSPSHVPWLIAQKCCYLMNLYQRSMPNYVSKCNQNSNACSVNWVLPLCS